MVAVVEPVGVVPKPGQEFATTRGPKTEVHNAAVLLAKMQSVTLKLAVSFSLIIIICQTSKNHQRSREYPRLKTNFYFTESYILKYLGQSCEDRGLEPIASEDKCKSLVSEFQNYYPDITYGRQLNRPDRPKGCYAMTKGKYFAVYFNLHQGGFHSDTRAACIPSGKNIFSKYLMLCKMLFFEKLNLYYFHYLTKTPIQI